MAGDTRSVVKAMTLVRVMGFLTALGVIVFGVNVLVAARQDARDQRTSADLNLVKAVAQEVTRNFELIDLSLQGVLRGLELPELGDLSPNARQMVLYDHSIKANYLSHVAVMDEHGFIKQDSSLSPLPTANFFDRDYFQVHRESTKADSFISHPLASRISAGDRVLAISRRINKPDGTFGGVVAAFIDIQYFDSLFSNLSRSRLDSFAAFAEDGTLLMRNPYRKEDIGKSLKSAELFKYFPQLRSGSFESDSTNTDNVPRIYSFARVGNYPLAVILGSSTEEVYDGWRTRAIGIGAVLLILTLSMAATSWLLSRELRRRAEAEHKLTLLANELDLAASTDALTGIPNRRSFEKAFSEEWLRSRREGGRLSLLFIDVDLFKQYNDTLGHRQGDAALRVVAACIENVMKRPGDLCARYGGEEFVAILPNTPIDGAYSVAEKIRFAVSGAGLAHPKGFGETVTVSIGVASCVPDDSGGRSKLLEAADEALYRAKKSGRNRTEITCKNFAQATLLQSNLVG